MDRLVTLVGGSGFVGRAAVEALARGGWRLRVAVRNTARATRLRPLANLGQLEVMRADLRVADSLRRAVAGADAVVNFVGLLAPAAGASFEAIHRDGAGALAAAALAAGAKQFVQVSAIGADPRSPSAYGRTKGEGEAAVRAAFPDAAVLRPSIVFGPEDQFTNRFAKLIALLPVVPVIAPRTRFQPVYVNDVGDAIARVLELGRHGVIDLAGPEVFSMRQINEALAAAIGADKRFVDVPDEAAAIMAKFGSLPGAPLTRDQWLMLQRDNVADGVHPGIESLGIEPTPMGAVMADWLVQYRTGGRFAGRQAAMGTTGGGRG